MGAVVEDHGDVYLSTDCDYTNGVEFFQADNSYLIDLIATNLSGVNGVIYAYIVHTSPADTSYTQHGWLAFNLPLPANNSWTSSKLAINNGDKLYVAGSAGISFHAQGMDQIA